MATKIVRRTTFAVLTVLVVLVVGVGICEMLGWPFLVAPAARFLSEKLERQVTLVGGQDKAERARLHLLWGMRVNAPLIEIGPPSWSKQPFTMRAQDVELRLRYRDLWALRQGEPLRVHALTAGVLEAHLERLKNGQASWQFGPAKPASSEPAQKARMPAFGRLEVTHGVIDVDDQLLQALAEARFVLREGDDASGGKPGLHASAQGKYQGRPLSITLRTGAVLPWVAGSPDQPAVDFTLRAEAGRTKLGFDGKMRDLFGMDGLSGSYTLSSTSLSTVGEALGITLPTTAAFDARGTLRREGALWHTDIAKFDVGRSALRGSFDYDTGRDVPLLTGKLTGAKLYFADLAPAVGAPTGGEPAPPPPPGKVLPVRDFDIPSLRAMDARVDVALDRVELGGLFAQPLTPLQGVIVLEGGVLTLDKLLAQTADGRIRGNIQLDGRNIPAVLRTALNWDGVKLERWLQQKREDGTAYVTGRVAGSLQLTGKGNSSAELLASSDGRAIVHWTRGSISHLVVEAAGIDVAQLLGLFIKGDAALPVHCAAADLKITRGVARPTVLLVDTRDSTIWADGTASLADEKLDLKLHVAPKDFSPLALRTPIHVRGTFANPDISLDKKPLVQKLVPAALLALLNPLAAVLPMLDPGNTDEAKAQAASCAITEERLKRNGGATQAAATLKR